MLTGCRLTASTTWRWMCRHRMSFRSVETSAKCLIILLIIYLLSGGKREDYQNCSVLYCVLKPCTVISTLRWAVLTVLWIGFCCTGPISLCVDLFVFICVYFVCFCSILHSCCIIVSVVRWTWCDWSLILSTYLPSVLWYCWLGHLTHKKQVPDMPYNVLGGSLNLALSIYLNPLNSTLPTEVSMLLQ